MIAEGTPNLDWRGFILSFGVSSRVFDYSTTDRRTLRQGINAIEVQALHILAHRYGESRLVLKVVLALSQT